MLIKHRKNLGSFYDIQQTRFSYHEVEKVAHVSVCIPKKPTENVKNLKFGFSFRFKKQMPDSIHALNEQLAQIGKYASTYVSTLVRYFGAKTDADKEQWLNFLRDLNRSWVGVVNGLPQASQAPPEPDRDVCEHGDLVPSS